mgnify:CR=1 FL=1
MKNIPLGQILVEAGLLTPDKLDEALRLQKEKHVKLGDMLIELGYITEDQLIGALEKRLGVPVINLAEKAVTIEAIQLVPEETARRNTLVPVSVDGGVLTVATTDPLNYYAFGEIEMSTGLKVQPMLARKSEIAASIEKYYSQYQMASAASNVNAQFDVAQLEDLRGEDYDEMLDRVEQAPVVRLVNTILSQAYKMRASDIHIEPGADNVRVRFRVDGDLIEAMLLNSTVHVSLVTRLKIMAGIDIAERRIPQDGRFTTDVNGAPLNVRVSTLPTVYGEKVVIRLLGDNTVKLMRLTELGMLESNYALFQRMIHSPNGIILMTGPTGSGKSTTIYAALTEINDPKVNIVTVEDPVEREIKNINQVQINNKAGLTFASGLRSILRQDPDIIMVGEIRDAETASIAARAAITGHLVLSTLHTNDAASSFLRLIDMGIEPYMVASSVIGVVAQRLVKLICPYCREEYTPTEAELAFFGPHDGVHFYHGKGCPRCNYTGYSGRTAVHEMLIVNQELRELILERAPSQRIVEAVKGQGFQSLKDNIALLVREGKTTTSELMRVTYLMD